MEDPLQRPTTKSEREEVDNDVAAELLQSQCRRKREKVFVQWQKPLSEIVITTIYKIATTQ